MRVQNPILRGFHPDPSIVRVEDDYYIATSTFEWWPGVKISHSKDLVHWNDIGYALTDTRILDLKGVGSSQGIWAPDLSYVDGKFYLVFTVVHSFYCNMYDTKNYLVTADNILGTWSEPVALNNFGFDPSLFHDDDGRKYIVSMVTDHRVPKKYVGCLALQEYCHENRQLIGEPKIIYSSNQIFLEGPHIFKRNGWYYLFAADTGTGEGHGQSILRSKSVWGPYEMFKAPFMERTMENEAYSIMTTRHNKDYPLQKAGHGDLVEAADGKVYMVHLCGRLLDRGEGAERRYVLGRETAIQSCKWTEDDWLVLSSETNCPDFVTQVGEGDDLVISDDSLYEDFSGETLSPRWQSSRVPMREDYHFSLMQRPGFLRLFGREGLASKFDQTLFATPITEFDFEATTTIEFAPTVFKQMAGLILMYDTENYLYLHLTYDEDQGKCISLLRAENKSYSYPIGFVPIEEGRPIDLKISTENEKAAFYYKYADETIYKSLAIEADYSFLSDEACREGWFTGTMVGICCQDLTGFGKHADFGSFSYVPKLSD